MRDKELSEVLAAIYGCLRNIARENADLDTEEFGRNMKTIRESVEGMGGSVED